MVKTQWNSTYYILQRFLELVSICCQMILFISNGSEMLLGSEIEVTKQIIVILKPFEFATRQTSAEKYVTLSKTLPTINCITSQIQETKTESKSSSDFDEDIEVSFETCFRSKKKYGRSF